MSPQGHLTQETLDLLHLGALGPEAREEAEGHLATCAACRAQREALAEDAARFSRFVLPRTLPEVERRAGGRRWRWALPSLVLAGAAAALLLVVVRPQEAPREEAVYVAARGEGSVRLVAARGGQQVTVAPDTQLREGDRLRFLVEPGQARWGLVVSRDGAGQWTVYYPYGGTRSARLEAGSQVLPGSIELDATGGTEHIFTVLSDGPLEASAVLQALKQEQPVRGAREVVETSFRKAAR